MCTDYVTLDSLIQNVTAPSQWSYFLNNLTYLVQLPERPAALDSTAMQMDDLAESVNASLAATLSFIQSHPLLTVNQPNACTLQCSQLVEPSPGPVTTNFGCPIGGQEPLCFFYQKTTTSTGVVISQLRPNASEGHATASYTTASGSVVFQFGGFACAGQHPGSSPFSHTDYDLSTCFSQTLYVLDMATNNLVWWAVNPPSAASGFNQFLLWPSSRAWASLAVDTVHSQLWLYGGAVVSQGRWQYLNDLYIFDITGQQWIPFTLVGQAPTASRAASLFFKPSSPLQPAVHLRRLRLVRLVQRGVHQLPVDSAAEPGRDSRQLALGGQGHHCGDRRHPPQPSSPTPWTVPSPSGR